MAVTDKERKLAATLSDPVLWGQAYPVSYTHLTLPTN